MENRTHQSDIENLVQDYEHDALNERSQPLQGGLPEYKVLLYRAALSGNWEAAKRIQKQHKDCFTESISESGDTALHIAAVAGQAWFVDALVDFMALHSESPSQFCSFLGKKNNNGNTALLLTTMSGVVSIAKKIAQNDQHLLRSRCQNNFTPLRLTINSGKGKMVQYILQHLHSLHHNYFTHQERVALFFDALRAGLYVNVFGGKEEKDLQTKALELVECCWKKVLQEPKERRSELIKELRPFIFDAVKVGNVEFVTTLVHHYPDLIWTRDDDLRKQTIFHIAIQFRQEKIFQFLFELGHIKDVVSLYLNQETGNSMLHLAAMLPSSHRLNYISGAALQMQREIWWFKVVEDMMAPSLATAENNEGKTPQTLFAETHEPLRKEGEYWMRNTASSCSVVAALIASVTFAATLRSPDFVKTNILSHGLNQYWLLAVLDSVSLISSTAALLTFLSILCSRYAQQDFRRSLPLKLMAGLTLLFLSIITMMAAFTTALSVVFRDSLLWAGISALACIPVFLFAGIQLPLLTEVYRSTLAWNFGSTVRVMKITSEELSELNLPIS